MNIQLLEITMAEVSELLMTPVIIVICLLVVYAIYALGKFASQWLQRRQHKVNYVKQIHSNNGSMTTLPGFPVHNYFIKNPLASDDELEVVALKQLETLRIVTRIAPMLGLIATMIPMGPALQALADGNIQGISENLIIAFAAVIWGLVISTLTFWPASVKKRWCADELINVRKLR
ncbi:MotA/TolQ/ExbB proton channel family protein [Thalassotalea sp. 1_MG-2023]|uniref:MotA/TolQ/ExbB proton channel family protein n=1 Tax=Thalassotalea sp. 1_MG-2023 TaxID=3062680 RepID=UPI0026E20B46|nr:MotA/TolQ/ExbB proton channel family protein [Thalassotalea sp. 1_MG-2023]MDO6426131.1 MotA/TolQ/ExbB proton channel family protein [Thalassotalea sp. 1_MG-2023]